MCYLLGEVVVLIVWHAGGNVVDDLSGGGGIVRRSLACATVPLETSHEATVSSEVDLRNTHTHHDMQSTLDILTLFFKPSTAA